MYEIAFEIKLLSREKQMGPQVIIIQSSRCYNSSIYTRLKKHGKDYGRVKQGAGVKEGYTEMVTFDLDLEG